MHILPSMAKYLLGRFCYASNFVQTPHIALRSYYQQQGDRSQPAVHMFSIAALTLCFGIAGEDHTFDGTVFHVLLEKIQV